MRFAGFACAVMALTAFAQYGQFGNQQQQQQQQGFGVPGAYSQNPQQQTTPVQTPSISNVPGRTGGPQQQQGQQGQQQQPAVFDPRFQAPQAPLYMTRPREERNEFQDFIEQ